MIITKLVFRALEIPLRFQFSQSNNPASNRSCSAICEVHTEEGIVGIGESCPRSYVTGESLKSVEADLKTIGFELKNTSITSVFEFKKRKQQWQANGIGPSSICCLELAWLDAFSRKQNKPLIQLFDHPENPMRQQNYSLVLPLLPATGLALLLPRLKSFRPPAVKLKINSDLSMTTENLGLIRDFFGENIAVRVDVNGGWTTAEAKHSIPELMELGIHSFEQPLAPDDLQGLKELTQEYGNHAAIMLDESLLTLAQAETYIAKGIGNHFNLKISKLGGLFNTLDIYELARQNNIPCQLGAHFGETSILSKAGVVFSALAGGDLTAQEGALGEFLLEKDIVQPVVQHDFAGSLEVEGILGAVGLCDCGTMGLWDCGTVGLWDDGTV